MVSQICYYHVSTQEMSPPKTGDAEPVLIRVYGHGTNLIIDRHREFISHLILNSIGLAPPVFARFKNGLVYGYLDGRS